MLLTFLLALAQAPVAAAAPKPIESLPPLMNDVLAVSPDHRRIAVSTWSEGVWVLDIASSSLVFRIQPAAWPARFMTWSEDGAMLAILRRDAEIEVRETGTGSVITRMHCILDSGRAEEDRVIQFASSGKNILAALGGRPTQIYSASTGSLIAQILHDNGAYATAIAMSPDGTRLALGTDQGGVAVWDPSSGRQLSSALSTPLGPWRRIRGLDFDARGERLAIAGGDCHIRVWRLNSNAPPRLFSFCDLGFADLGGGYVQFSQDSTLVLATTYPDWRMRVWQVQTEQVLSTNDYGSGGGRSLSAWFSADGVFAYTSPDLRRLSTTDTERTVHLGPPEPSATLWSSDGDYAWAVVDHHLVVRKIPDEEPVLRVKVGER